MGIFDIASLAFKFVDRLLPNEAAERKAELAAELQQQIGQLEINKMEAGHRSMFVAGWRPFIGWVCGLSFAYHFLVVPIVVFTGTVVGSPIDLPTFDMGSLMTVLMGMLGLGGLRTYEKYKGISK